MEVRFTRALRKSVKPRHYECLHQAHPQPQPQWRTHPQGDSARHSLHTSSRRCEAKQQWKQAMPLGGYYDLILSNPHSSTSPNVHPTTPAPVPAPPSAKRKLTLEEKQALEAQRAETAARLGKLFSPLTGPEKDARRAKEIEAQSRMIAGVMVPPKPEEPDNCCMSGCVNCVWDTYGEEVEVWSTRKREARKAMRKLGIKEEGGLTAAGTPPAGTSAATSAASPAQKSVSDAVGESMSMDDDGVSIGMEVPDDPLADVPVGIREFMRQEKKLKQKKLNANANANAAGKA